MPYAVLEALLAVLIPIAIGLICLFARRESWTVIVVLSATGLTLEALNLFMYLLEIVRIVPFTSSSLNYSLYDSARSIFSNIAFYAGFAAWVLSLYRAVQRGRLWWMAVVGVAAMVSLICRAMESEPYYFFSRLTYNGGIALLLVMGAHLVSAITLIYALATRRDTAPAAPMPIMYPPMMYPPMMYPPMIYPPMMYPPPAPYGPPVSYAPPPPVVLPAPQPQPPTMTTPT